VRSHVFAATLALVLLTSSCGPPPRPPITAEQVSKIKKGVTTRAQIIQMFGVPGEDLMGGMVLIYKRNIVTENTANAAVSFFTGGVSEHMGLRSSNRSFQHLQIIFVNGTVSQVQFVET